MARRTEGCRNKSRDTRCHVGKGRRRKASTPEPDSATTTYRVAATDVPYLRPTPAVGWATVGGRSPARGQGENLKPSRITPVAISEVSLVAYSCGGSSGLEPRSLLTPSETLGRGEPSTLSTVERARGQLQLRVTSPPPFAIPSSFMVNIVLAQARSRFSTPECS